LGTILVDSYGMTLYTFKSDSPGKSSCYGGCAQNWPPLIAGDHIVAAEGVRGLIDAIDRTDGTRQVTFNGMPLYYFVQDKAPGDAKGQGINNVWFVVNPSTAPASQKPPVSTTVALAGGDPSGQFIAKTSDVPSNTVFDFTYNGDKAILVNFNGAFSAFVNKCPHKGCQQFSEIKDGALVCPCHGSQFDPASGDVKTGPAMTGLTVIPIKVVGDSVYVQ